MHRKRRFKIFIGIIIAFVLMASVLLEVSGCGESGINVTTMKESDETSEESNVKIVEDSEDITSEEQSKNDTICVYICGAVVNEGVYEVPAGSRVSDVLDEAGGYSEEALHGYVNLAKTLEDGERIYIPDEQELKDLGILEGDGSSGLVNINTADAETLKTLSGIGDKKASDIIAYREEHGAFSSIEDIKNVSGIGEASYEKLKDYITVD